MALLVAESLILCHSRVALCYFTIFPIANAPDIIGTTKPMLGHQELKLSQRLAIIAAIKRCLRFHSHYWINTDN